MAGNRIRSVRPELVENPRFGSMSDGARALWLQLYPLWDDEGRSLGSVAYVHGRCCFARAKSKAAIGRELAELEASGWIKRYSVAGVDYMAVHGWADPDSATFQYIKESKRSKLPAPQTDPWTNDGAKVRPNDGAKPGRMEGDQDQDRGVGKGGGAGARAPGGTSDTPTPLPIGWLPEESDENRAAREQAISRGVDVNQQLENLRNHALAKGTTSRDWCATWRLWLAKAHEAKPDEPQQRPRKMTTFNDPPRASTGQPMIRPKYDEPDVTNDELGPKLSADDRSALWAEQRAQHPELFRSAKPTDGGSS